jgi:hypothetical protein
MGPVIQAFGASRRLVQFGGKAGPLVHEPLCIHLDALMTGHARIHFAQTILKALPGHDRTGGSGNQSFFTFRSLMATIALKLHRFQPKQPAHHATHCNRIARVNPRKSGFEPNGFGPGDIDSKAEPVMPQPPFGRRRAGSPPP